MHADLSRDTFDPARHFARVLMQQGRVPLDADLNEQSAILLHYLRCLAADLIGPHGGPASGTGFRVRPADGKPKDFVIGEGRYYVDGILVENHTADYPVTGETLENAWQRSGHAKREPLARPFLLYLDVWERHVTALQDTRIREVALGGPDTATRVEVKWDVRAWPLDGEPQPVDLPALWDEILPQLAPPRGDPPPALQAMAGAPGTGTHDPCVLPPDARYRGLENQLYRVEIHGAGSTANGEGAPTFKWSRENGSVFFSLRSLQGTVAEVETLGLDARLDLSPGDWVEITDDERAGRGETFLVQVTDVDRDEMRVTVGDRGIDLPVYDQSDAAKHPVMRRWDHSATMIVTRAADGKPRSELAAGGAVEVEPGWIDLEDGIQVRFAEDAAYAPGDHWLIPARVATGDVEWPLDGSREAAFVPARRVEHHYAPLAVVPEQGGLLEMRRCMETLATVCGDG